MNSARSLLALLEEWQPQPGGSSVQVRAESDPDSQSFWAEHRRALEWLSDIESAINALGADGNDVTVYRGALPYWYQGVFAYRTDWNTSSTARLVEKPYLDLLQALAGLLDFAKWEPQFGDQQANIFETLVHAEDLIRNDESLSDPTRRYLLQLLHGVRFNLETIDTNGTAAARSATMQLVGALTTTAATADTVQRQKSYLKAAVELARVAGTVVTTKAVEGGWEWLTSLTGG